MRWFINRKIATKIFFCFGAVIAIGLAVGALTFQSLSSIQIAGRWTIHTLDVLEEAQTLTINVIKQAAASRAGRLPNGQGHSVATKAADETVDGGVRTLIALTADNPGQQRRLAELKGVLEAWQRQLRADESAAESRAGDAREDELLDQALAKLNDVISEEKHLLAIRTHARTQAYSWAYLVSGFGPLVALLIATMVGWALQFVIARPLAHLTLVVRRLAVGTHRSGCRRAGATMKSAR